MAVVCAQDVRGDLTPAGLVRHEWAALLGRVPWDYFVTLTFDPKRHPRSGVESWVKAWRWFLFAWVCACAKAAGQCREWDRPEAWQETERGTWRRRPGRVGLSGPWINAWRRGARPSWVLALEPHQDGRLHAHVLVKLSGDLRRLDYRVGQDLWRGSRGVCWFEKPRSRERVAEYVAKYVTKWGSDALTFSENFDAARLACC